MPTKSNAIITTLTTNNKNNFKVGTSSFTSTEWVCLTDIPTAPSSGDLNDRCRQFWNKFTNGNYCGVYQVSMKRPKQLVHKDICYIGRSTILPKRLNSLRGSATPKNKVTHHACGVYIREEKIDMSRVYIRCIIPDISEPISLKEMDATISNIERWLQNEHKAKFNYKLGFAWEEASGGFRSARIACKSHIKRLNSVEACREAIDDLLEKMLELMQSSK
jgi:hypothetical protein